MLCTQIAFAQNNKAKAPASRTPPVMPQLPPQLMPPHPANKMGIRYFNIDAKRMIEDVNGEDALPRSREFKRLDSTYYVGWMFEGAYKYNHAADYLGFRNAAVPLERALDLMEHDYAKGLATRTGDVMTFYPIRALAPDYTMIAYYLMSCYANTDQPDKVYKLLRRTLKWNFQASYYMDSWNHLAWTVHRNRFYTSAKYSFLKNSIDENEKLANRYLDTSLIMVAKNNAINEQLGASVPFLHGNAERERFGVYHYKNILYSYAYNIDSAEYYFDLMRKAGKLPHNNYANFKSICGDFRTAETEYKLASMQDAGDKRLQEWAYYTSILDIYKAKPMAGAGLSRNMIKAAGSTPGYGWYNIALARCMSYDGQISESERYVDKAADFKELHIGTTLGQSHYDFSVQLLKLINKEKAWQMQKFEHANWWYNPSVLITMSQKLSETYLQQLLIINQFAQNPERDRVIYKLFSTESTVSWDEIWYLVHDFSTQFFIKRFQREAEKDNRAYIRKYFELFVAKLKMQQGKYKEAKPVLDGLLKDPNMDADYEKLFTARVCEAQAQCAKELKTGTQDDWLYRLYTVFPQLVPFTGVQMNMNLHISGEVDPAVEKRLRACNINWVTNRSIPAPDAYVTFSHTGKNRDITYYVVDQTGHYIVRKQSFAWQKPDEAGTQLAYRLFNIGSKDEEEHEDLP
jgi:hypothetical protein